MGIVEKVKKIDKMLSKYFVAIHNYLLLFLGGHIPVEKQSSRRLF